ncbi:uncharacterized protein LOC122532481 [Frieseomelitta varia]|uniref:uncharacterized protein LOC122532481 n=1 Tax=Frieseomelitta varia TaxID=561572 RepID=UPI001CB694EF|nr:uncharacterized protein LOC122532481 [Frieseomelitta varia]
MTNQPVSIEANSVSNAYIDYSIQLNRWSLKPIGAWPYFSTTTTYEKIVSVILIVLCYAILLFSIIPCVAHLIFVDDILYSKIRVFGTMGHWLIGGISYTNLLFQGRRIGDCVEHMEADWRIVTKDSEQQVMLKRAKFGRYVSIICAIFVHSGAMSYCIVSASNTQTIDIGNETRTFRTLPLSVYNKMIPVETSPANEIVIVMQFLSAFISDSGGIGFYVLASVLAAHACGQLDVLAIWINDYVNESRDKNEDGSFRRIEMIVQHHLRILDFIARIEEIMSWVCMTELFRCILAICMVGYFIIMEWSEHDVRNLATYFIVFISVTFNTFVLCYIGELLTEQCLKVGEIVYMTNWYYLPVKKILDLILIIVRSSMVIELTAGKIIQMSIYTFGDVMRLAFAYLNILVQIT